MRALVHFIAVSTFLHLSWLYCIRDLHRYLSVTRTSGMTPHFHNLNPPADRVFIFAVTGLKLNHTYEVQEDSTSNMPFIRTVIRRQGRWGVMHSTAPTLLDTYHMYKPYLTGVTQQDYYEDDVNYDSLLNASSRSWVWSNDAHSVTSDNPDIESKIYKKGMNNVNCSTYNSWIFNSIEDLLLIHSNEKIVANKLNHSGSVFLVNVDASNCSQLQNDLKSLDQKINRTTDLINSYFGDNRTTYLLFGIPEKAFPLTELLPFIAWGAGIKHPRSAQYGDYRYNDNLDVNWNLEKFERIDLQMIDIAALVATLLGLRIPTHSQGTVPHGYIHYNKEFVAKALLANAKQFMEQVNVVEQEIQSLSMPAFFRPYKPLTFPDRVMIVEKAEQLINQRKLQDVVENSLQVINKCKEALRYFKTYHHLSLKLSFALTSMGWIIYTVSILCREGNGETLYSFPSIPCVIVCLVVCSLHYYHGVSNVYYVYHALPLLTWDLAVRKGKRIYRKIQKALENINQLVVNMVVLSFVMLGLQIVFLGLIHNARWLLMLMMLIGCLVPFIALRRHSSIWFTATWFMLCTLIGSYPLLPQSQTTLNAVLPPMVFLLLIVLHVYLFCNPFLQYKLTRPRNRVCSTFNTLLTDTLICLLAGLIAVGNTCELITKDLSHLLSSVILATAALLLLFSPRSVPGRLLHTATLSIVVFYILDGSSNIVYLLLLVLLLFFTLFMVDMDPKQTENAVGVLWNGMFGCLYFSDFPMRNTSVKDGRLPSINDTFRTGYFILLMLTSITAVVDELDLMGTSAVNLATYPFSYYTSFVSIVLCIKLVLPVFCIYCMCSVIAVKYGVTFMDFACLSLVMMDIIALELFLFTDLTTAAFVIVVLNALFCPPIFSLARITLGNSVIPRKTCDEDK